MKTLPIIESCEGCGACCMEQSSPPGYVFILVRGANSWPDEEDVERFQNLPPEALRELKTYLSFLKRGTTKGETPCIWYDKNTRGCRYYEHRPNICRDFEMGSDGCRKWRRSYGVS